MTKPHRSQRPEFMPSRERIERMKKEIRAARESEKQAMKQFLSEPEDDEDDEGREFDE